MPTSSNAPDIVRPADLDENVALVATESAPVFILARILVRRRQQPPLCAKAWADIGQVAIGLAIENFVDQRDVEVISFSASGVTAVSKRDE